MRKSRRGVEDRWTKRDGTPTANAGKGKRWRARYVDDRGGEHSKGFDTKREANRWLDQQTAALVSGKHVSPRDARTTVSQWCETWLQGYSSRRPGTVSNAKDHIRWIEPEFGHMTLSEVRPSQVKTWLAKMQAHGLSDSFVHAIHKRLSQILSDAVHDNLLGSNPCSRRTSPPPGKQKPYVATTEQVWALHDEMPEHLKAAVLLSAFVGLRIGEVIGLRVADVDFMRGVVHVAVQQHDAPLKTKSSAAPVPIPQELALMLSASVQRFGTEMMVTNGRGRPCPKTTLQRVIIVARKRVDGLPPGFSLHDLRHYFASMLIASGASTKTVQARLRHSSAMTTLDIYGHLWPDADESTRSAVAAAIRERVEGMA